MKLRHIGWLLGVALALRGFGGVARAGDDAVIKGKVVLLGFRAQHRAQTPATFPFLFGALYWSTAR